MYLKKFILPTCMEEEILCEKAAENGGYIDNAYPCGIFQKKELSEIYFDKITIFYGGNGSGKSTLLNLISEKLLLNRIAPFNSSETFIPYLENCSYSMATDEEGFDLRVPNGSRIITSDDIFDYMLTVRTNNNEIKIGRASCRERVLFLV